jgi:hypothetical protein
VFDLGTGQHDINLRHYSGGIQLDNMDGSDVLSIESMGQLIVDGTCSNANITLRGLMTITDNGSSTTLTRDAAISGAYAASIAADTATTRPPSDTINGASYSQIIRHLSLNKDSLDALEAWVAQQVTLARDTVLATQIIAAIEAINITATNLSQIASADSLSLGSETNTFAATQVHDSVWYQVLSTGASGNINTWLEFDIGDDAQAARLSFHGRLHEGSAPSGGDEVHTYGYDWFAAEWVHINPPGVGLVGIAGSDASDDATFVITLTGARWVDTTTGNVGKIRMTFSNYNPDSTVANDLEANTELFLDLVLIEFQSVLTAAKILAVIAGDTIPVKVTKPESLLAIIDNIRGMSAGMGLPDSGMAYRYIATTGASTNGGTSWEDAWDVDGFDSISVMAAPTTIFVAPGSYADVAVDITTSGIRMIGVGGAGLTHLRYTADTIHTSRIIEINDSAGANGVIRGVEIAGFSLGHKVSYTTTPPDPEFQCAIWIHDSVESVRIHHNLFVADSNFKTISAGNGGGGRNLWNKTIEIDHNRFFRNRTHALDLGTQNAYIHDNLIIDTRDYLGNNPLNSVNTIEPIQLIADARANVIADNYVLSGNIPIILRGADSNMIAGNWLGLKWSQNRPIEYSSSPRDNASVGNMYQIPSDSGNNSSAMTQEEFIRDSVNASASVSEANMRTIASYSADSNWMSQMAARSGESGSWGEDALNWDATGAGVSGSGAYHDTIRVVDTSQVPDDTLTNVDIKIDNFARVRRSQVNTGSNGIKAVAKLDDEGLTFAVNATGIFQDGGVDSITPPAKDTAFTIQVFSYGFTPPPGGDSTLAVIFTSVPRAVAIFTPVSSNFADTAGKVLDPATVVEVADANGTIQATLPRTNATKQKTTWTIEIWNTGEPLKVMMTRIYTVPDVAVDTLTVEATEE